MANKESAVQKALVDAILKDFPGAYVRKIAQSMYSHNGIPDLIGCINGNFFAVEVKTEKGRPSRLQDYEIKLIKEAGGTALICYGKDAIPAIVMELHKCKNMNC